MANTLTKKQENNRPAGSQSGSGSQQKRAVGQDVLEYLRDYAREKPEIAACWCLGIGFVLGWKLKPW